MSESECPNNTYDTDRPPETEEEGRKFPTISPRVAFSVSSSSDCLILLSQRKVFVTQSKEGTDDEKDTYGDIRKRERKRKEGRRKRKKDFFFSGWMEELEE